MIRLERLRKTYKDITALRDVDLRVPEGQLLAYLGPNGAGKTTTIRMLTGLTRPSGGDAWLGGCHILNDMIGAKRQCGLVPQSINLDQELTVGQNLDIHGRLFGMPATLRRERIREMLAVVDLADREHKPAKTLSGGMKRRVMIARALLHAPKILFLDEPTVGLDAAIRRRIWALIKTIQQRGTTIFLTTHYIEEAEFLADRVAFLNAGSIVAVDGPQALMDRLGAWAIDRVEDGEMKARYFRTREQAHAALSDQERDGDGGFSLRRVNLEDAFLSLTGTPVVEKEKESMS